MVKLAAIYQGIKLIIFHRSLGIALVLKKAAPMP